MIEGEGTVGKVVVHLTMIKGEGTWYRSTIAGSF